jgi:hypothetical protein
LRERAGEIGGVGVCPSEKERKVQERDNRERDTIAYRPNY